MKKRLVFDEAFKRMAVDLSYAKGSVHEAARELGIDSSRTGEPVVLPNGGRFTKVLLRLPLLPVG